MTRSDDFLLLTLVGPSGTGKSTLAKKLLQEFPEFALSVSYTTRAARIGEVDGQHYHFIEPARFNEMIERDLFLEWAEVHGNFYGTSREPVEAARGTSGGIVFDVDYQGARQIRARTGDIVGVFILPPSMVELERRLRARGTDTDEVIAKRMRKAAAEIEHYPVFDYLIVNDTLDHAYDELRSIVVAERGRRWRRAHRAEALLATGPAGPRAAR